MKEHSDSKHKYSEDDIIKIFEFLVDNIFCVFFFARKVFQQTVGIPMGTNCAPLLTDIRTGIHTVFALNGKETVSISVQSHLQVHRWCILHKQHKIRKLSGPDVSYWTWDQRHNREYHFCFLVRFTSVDWEGWSTSIYDKRDDCNFHITNFPFLSSNNPSSPAHGVFIPQLIRYACSPYECFILRARRLSSKLFKQGYLVKRLKSPFRKFYGRYGDLIQQ